VRRVKKANENLPLNEFEAYRQLEFERMCNVRRLSSEWRIKNVKNS
jgi:hypothetical protein